MSRAIFVGPTLSPNRIDALLSGVPSTYLDQVTDLEKFDILESDFFIFPPVKAGDACKLANIHGIKFVGIIDGYFESVPSVWHKELLYLLSKGIALFGSSSMGALRAAELHTFGMVGLGKIFEDFRSGILTDDDEVTISHGPGDLNYTNISEAMVNIRATIKKAIEEDILTQEYAETFLRCGKDTFYKKRNYGFLIHRCVSEFGLNRKPLDNFATWLQKNRVDQKALDAELLVKTLLSADSRNFVSQISDFHMEDTLIWRKFIDR